MAVEGLPARGNAEREKMAIVIAGRKGRPVVRERVRRGHFEAFTIGVSEAGVERDRIIASAAAEFINKIDVTIIGSGEADKFRVEGILGGQADVCGVDAHVRGGGREIARRIADDREATGHGPRGRDRGGQ